ncbi:hypothetical protein MSG28_005239 [Choristoneura fumiferana]|uniref:Uncharacterized protein n=1 Tax=Choristoneura fumiferana TaxID=7141 RepID=A0ACC0JQW7_CHOFU|nr:hypothetical protein MSG28_005239 [Choristoneura fumiferana]
MSDWIRNQLKPIFALKSIFDPTSGIDQNGGEDMAKAEEPKVTSNFKKAQIGVKPKKITPQYKLPLQKQNSDEAINIMFDKCRLSLKNKPICEDSMNNNDSSDLDNISTASSVDLNIEDNVFPEETIEVNTDDKINRKRTVQM